jgi:hypothetical protein
VTFKGSNEWVKLLLQTVGPWSSKVEYFVTFKGGNKWVKPLLQTTGPWCSNLEYFETFKGGNDWVKMTDEKKSLICPPVGNKSTVQTSIITQQVYLSP